MTTDPECLDQALARAAWQLTQWGRGEQRYRHLAGWAEAVKALSVLDVSFHVQHGGYCGCDRIRARDAAIRRFCVVMLGEEDESLDG